MGNSFRNIAFEQRQLMKKPRVQSGGGETPTLEELLALPLYNTDRTLLAFGRAMAAWARIEVGFYAWFEHITLFDARQAKPI